MMLCAGKTRSGSSRTCGLRTPLYHIPNWKDWDLPPTPLSFAIVGSTTTHLSIFESCMVSGPNSSPLMAETIIPPAYKTEEQNGPPSLRDGLYILTNNMSRTVLDLYGGTSESEAFVWSDEIQLIIFHYSRKLQWRDALRGVRA